MRTLDDSFATPGRIVILRFHFFLLVDAFYEIKICFEKIFSLSLIVSPFLLLFDLTDDIKSNLD